MGRQDTRKKNRRRDARQRKWGTDARQKRMERQYARQKKILRQDTRQKKWGDKTQDRKNGETRCETTRQHQLRMLGRGIDGS